MQNHKPESKELFAIIYIDQEVYVLIKIIILKTGCTSFQYKKLAYTWLNETAHLLEQNPYIIHDVYFAVANQAPTWTEDCISSTSLLILLYTATYRRKISSI